LVSFKIALQPGRRGKRCQKVEQLELHSLQAGAMTATAKLKVGKIYRLRFPGIAARVIEPPPGVVVSLNFPYLVESIFLRSRWWVNERGEPDNIYSPLMVIPAGDPARARAGNHVLI
jgi:hypothetical protein